MISLHTVKAICALLGYSSLALAQGNNSNADDTTIVLAPNITVTTNITTPLNGTSQISVDLQLTISPSSPSVLPSIVFVPTSGTDSLSLALPSGASLSLGSPSIALGLDGTVITLPSSLVATPSATAGLNLTNPISLSNLPNLPPGITFGPSITGNPLNPGNQGGAPWAKDLFSSILKTLKSIRITTTKIYLVDGSLFGQAPGYSFPYIGISKILTEEILLNFDNGMINYFQPGGHDVAFAKFCSSCPITPILNGPWTYPLPPPCLGCNNTVMQANCVPNTFQVTPMSSQNAYWGQVSFDRPQCVANCQPRPICPMPTCSPVSVPTTWNYPSSTSCSGSSSRYTSPMTTLWIKTTSCSTSASLSSPVATSSFSQSFASSFSRSGVWNQTYTTQTTASTCISCSTATTSRAVSTSSPAAVVTSVIPCGSCPSGAATVTLPPLSYSVSGSSQVYSPAITSEVAASSTQEPSYIPITRLETCSTCSPIVQTVVYSIPVVNQPCDACSVITLPCSTCAQGTTTVLAGPPESSTSEYETPMATMTPSQPTPSIFIGKAVTRKFSHILAWIAFLAYYFVL